MNSASTAGHPGRFTADLHIAKGMLKWRLRRTGSVDRGSAPSGSATGANTDPSGSGGIGNE
jgi:hypothetical protein